MTLLFGSSSPDSRPQVRVGVISLAEAGNLGDDLILLAVLASLQGIQAEVTVLILSHHERLDLEDLGQRLDLSLSIIRVPVGPELIWVKDNRRTFAGCDLIIFGGGGLLQDSHLPDKPYQWLSYLPTGKTRPPVLAVGHGLGPMSHLWLSRLRRLGSPFDESWVRDTGSRELSVNELGWPASLTTDFVDPGLLRHLIQENDSEAPRQCTVGVAVRSWPGLSVTVLSRHIREVAARHGCTSVTFFVLEAKSGTGPDVSFSREVMSCLKNLDAELIVYSPSALPDVIAKMSRCTVAIGMKLHACAVWGFLGVDTYPIFYAPKVAALFGRNFSGLELVNQILPIPPGTEGAKSSQSVVIERAPALIESGSQSEFSYPTRLRIWHQARIIAHSIALRISFPPRRKK